MTLSPSEFHEAWMSLPRSARKDLALRLHEAVESDEAFGGAAEVARRFVSAILDHIDGILVLPSAGRARDDVRPGMRTSTFKKSLVA